MKHTLLFSTIAAIRVKEADRKITKDEINVLLNLKPLQEIYDLAAPEKKEQLLYKDSLSLFQKIIVMRTMRLDRSNDFLIDYVKAILGTEFTNPTMFNISDVFNQSTSEEPGIIISAPMKS